ncbi:hypothetical protein [Microbacterium sp. SL75]|uniref:hypothetical protein n=1 Tax=Microbacterium sp. SL75 TaxID=2995140 RepID=UPI00226F226B|nr:hypothetical protein [Microbacterium sp. SL75]WAC69351.1 hypothetical protein OVA17_01235 [Microbacterium sp. SL75]
MSDSNSAEVPRLRGQVAELVSDREVILNRGSNHGVQEGQYFAILNPDTIGITDPETGEDLGGIRVVKVVVVAVEVAAKLTLARTFRTKTLNVGGSSTAASTLAGVSSMFNPPKYVETVEKLTIDRNAPRKISPSESVVSKGDPFEEAYEDEVEDVRTITLFEADDRWRAGEVES